MGDACLAFSTCALQDGSEAELSKGKTRQSSKAWRAACPGCEVCLLCCAGKVTSKADIYSFGVVIWEICTLERPAWRGMLRDIRCASSPFVTICAPISDLLPEPLSELGLALARSHLSGVAQSSDWEQPCAPGLERPAERHQRRRCFQAWLGSDKAAVAFVVHGCPATCMHECVQSTSTRQVGSSVPLRLLRLYRGGGDHALARTLHLYPIWEFRLLA